VVAGSDAPPAVALARLGELVAEGAVSADGAGRFRRSPA
jgi:hypothetical protein